jgi:AraC-like DNA-binding protein
MPLVPTHLSDEVDSPERGAWDSVRDGWQQLYGSFEKLGVSVEMHDFRSTASIDWARSFHPRSLEICLNISGRGEVSAARGAMSLAANNAGFYRVGRDPLQASRIAKDRHRFATFEFSQEFLARQFAGQEDSLAPIVRDSLSARSRSVVGGAEPFSASQQRIAESLCAPPVPAAALPLWYQSKTVEIMAECFFQRPNEELFCSRQKRLKRERVERVCGILRARLVNPPSLEELGRETGVSQFYLSRIFSEEMGMTIPQYLRRVRMLQAAELLRAGRHNVTEAAFAVGYSSLGHFSKSFCEVVGCCPALYPHAKNLAPAR